MELLLQPEAIVALLTLTFLEIILGIDNIIFISIVTGKLPEDQRKKATRIGLLLAMFMRIAMLFGITWLIAMKVELFEINPQRTEEEERIFSKRFAARKNALSAR